MQSKVALNHSMPASQRGSTGNLSEGGLKEGVNVKD